MFVFNILTTLALKYLNLPLITSIETPLGANLRLLGYKNLVGMCVKVLGIFHKGK